MKAWSLSLLSISCVVGVTFAMTSGCTEGVSPDCPDMPYAGAPNSPLLDDWREEAIEKGCITAMGGNYLNDALQRELDR